MLMDSAEKSASEDATAPVHHVFYGSNIWRFVISPTVVVVVLDMEHDLVGKNVPWYVCVVVSLGFVIASSTIYNGTAIWQGCAPAPVPPFSSIEVRAPALCCL